MLAKNLPAWLVLVQGYVPYLWAGCGVLVGLMLLGSLVSRRGSQKGGGASWSSRHELRKAFMLGKVGVVLGRIGSTVLRYWGQGHIFLVAATQTGKSRSVVMTTLLERGWRRPRWWRRTVPQTSVIVHDIKDDLHPATKDYRSTFSKVVHLAPMDPTTDHYDPLSAIGMGESQETADLQMVAKMLVNPEGKIIENEGSQHYVEMTEIVVAGLLAYGLLTGLATTLGEFYQVTTQGGLAKVFKDMVTFDHPLVRQAGHLLLAADDKQYAGLEVTLMRVFKLYGDPQVAAMVSCSDFTLQDLRQGSQPLSLYLSIPFGHLERLRPLTCLCFRQWLGHAITAPRGWRKLGWHKLLVMGEEFPSLKHLDIAKDIMNLGAGLGVQLCLITPSMNEIEDIWGVHHNFLDNAHVQVYFGITDERVAERVSRRLGTQRVVKKRVTLSGGRRSVTREVVEEPVMTSSAITHMDPDDVLIVARQQQVIAQQTPWDQLWPWAGRGVQR